MQPRLSSYGYQASDSERQQSSLDAEYYHVVDEHLDLARQVREMERIPWIGGERPRARQQEGGYEIGFDTRRWGYWYGG